SAAAWSIRGVKSSTAPRLTCARAFSPISARTSVRSKTFPMGFESRALTMLAAGHGIDGNIDGYFGLVCFHCAGDLHRREHKTAGCVEHEIDRHIVGRILD